MNKGKERANYIYKLECKVRWLEQKLDLKQQQLADKDTLIVAKEMKLKEAEMWQRVYKERYLDLLEENENLKATNIALSNRNQNLVVALKTCRVLLNAIKRKGVI